MDELFCKNLRKLRASTRMTQKEFSARIGLPKSTYALYETGAREPNMETVRNIVETFGISMDYLFGSISKYEIEPGIVDEERERMYALKVFLNDFRYDISLRNGRYRLIREDGCFDVEQNELQKLFSSASSFVQVETKKLYKQLQGAALASNVNAAHIRTDIVHDDELQKHDDDIMDDDSF